MRGLAAEDEEAAMDALHREAVAALHRAADHTSGPSCERPAPPTSTAATACLTGPGIAAAAAAPAAAPRKRKRRAAPEAKKSKMAMPDMAALTPAEQALLRSQLEASSPPPEDDVAALVDAGLGGVSMALADSDTGVLDSTTPAAPGAARKGGQSAARTRRRKSATWQAAAPMQDARVRPEVSIEDDDGADMQPEGPNRGATEGLADGTHRGDNSEGEEDALDEGTLALFADMDRILNS